MPIVEEICTRTDFDGVSEDAKFKLTCSFSDALARAGAAAAAARPNEPEHLDRLSHAVERVTAALFDDKTGPRPGLDLRADQIRAGLGQRMPAKDLSSRINHN